MVTWDMRIRRSRSEQSGDAETEVQASATQDSRLQRVELWFAAAWVRVRTIDVSRLLLGLAGGGTLGVGMFNAFRAEASTIPVIVGAVLLIAALLISPEWRDPSGLRRY